MVEALHCTTDIGAERPIHKCGNPMSKMYVRCGRQVWRCGRHSCNEAQRLCGQSEKGRETQRRRNARRIRLGDTYMGSTSPEQAAVLKAHLRERLADFKKMQREEYANHFGRDS